MFGLFMYTVLDEESDFQVKLAQCRHPEVENRGSRILIVGFLVVCLHRMQDFVCKESGKQCARILPLECPNRAFRLRLGRRFLENLNAIFTTKNLQLVYPPL